MLYINSVHKDITFIDEMDKKIIILARVSSLPQDINGQTKDLKREAERLGYDEAHQIVIETVESAIKLSEEERLGLRKMKHHIEKDPSIDCVICWEISRLARQQKVLYSIRDYLLARKIQLYIITPPTKLLSEDRSQLDPSANIVFSLFATLSENEMMIKKERFSRARSEMKQRGQKFGGATVFGYIKDKEKKCVPHPRHSKIIVDLFNHYVTTDSSLYETYLYANSIYPDVFPLNEYKKSQHKIQHLFDKEVYVTGNWCYPPLITKEVWDKAHEKMSKSKCQARYKCKRELLCRGKIYCGHCGKMMTGSGGNTKAYICPTDKLHSIQINWDIADWIIWEETRTVVNINSGFDINQRINETQRGLDSKINQKQQYEIKIEELKQQSEKLLALYLNNKVSEELFNKRNDDIIEQNKIYTEYINKLNVEIATLQTVIEDTKNEFNIKPINVDKVDDFATRQEFVRKYISKMIVSKGEEPRTAHIKFEYALPLICCKSEYLYVYKNQANSRVYRINEDGTVDWIYSNDKRAKRDKETGRFTKTEE